MMDDVFTWIEQALGMKLDLPVATRFAMEVREAAGGLPLPLPSPTPIFDAYMNTTAIPYIINGKSVSRGLNATLRDEIHRGIRPPSDIDEWEQYKANYGTGVVAKTTTGGKPTEGGAVCYEEEA